MSAKRYIHKCPEEKVENEKRSEWGQRAVKNKTTWTMWWVHKKEREKNDEAQLKRKEEIIAWEGKDRKSYWTERVHSNKERKLDRSIIRRSGSKADGDEWVHE